MSPPHSRRSMLAASGAALAASSLAGCLAELEPSDSDGDASDPDGGNPTPSFPPGVDAAGLEDHEALLAAHRDRLRENGFVIDLAIRDGPDTSDRSEPVADVTVERGAEGASFALSGTVNMGAGTEPLDQWVTESHAITRVDRDDEPRYHVTDRGGRSMREYLVPAPLSDGLADGSFDVEDTVVHDGVTLTTLVATDLDPAPWADDTTDVAGTDSATLVVDETGVIREASIAHPAAEGAVSYAVVASGVDELTEPAWVEDVPEVAFASVAVDIDVLTGENTLELESVGDDPVPAGSTVTVTHDATDYRTTLDPPLPPGDVRYFTVQDGALVSADEPPSDAARKFESPISVSVVSPAGVSFANASMGWSSDSGTEAGDDETARTGTDD